MSLAQVCDCLLCQLPHLEKLFRGKKPFPGVCKTPLGRGSETVGQTFGPGVEKNPPGEGVGKHQQAAENRGREQQQNSTRGLHKKNCPEGGASATTTPNMRVEKIRYGCKKIGAHIRIEKSCCDFKSSLAGKQPQHRLPPTTLRTAGQRLSSGRVFTI